MYRLNPVSALQPPASLLRSPSCDRLISQQRLTGRQEQRILGIDSLGDSRIAPQEQLMVRVVVAARYVRGQYRPMIIVPISISLGLPKRRLRSNSATDTLLGDQFNCSYSFKCCKLRHRSFSLILFAQRSRRSTQHGATIIIDPTTKASGVFCKY